MLVPAIRDLPEGSNEGRSRSNPRDRMLKDKEENPPSSKTPEFPSFSSPYPDHGGFFSEWVKFYLYLLTSGVYLHNGYNRGQNVMGYILRDLIDFIFYIKFRRKLFSVHVLVLDF